MDALSAEIAKGIFGALVMFGALVWAIRLWTYAPPVPPEEFNRIRFRNRLLTVPLWAIVLVGINGLWLHL